MAPQSIIYSEEPMKNNISDCVSQSFFTYTPPVCIYCKEYVTKDDAYADGQSYCCFTHCDGRVAHQQRFDNRNKSTKRDRFL